MKKIIFSFFLSSLFLACASKYFLPSAVYAQSNSFISVSPVIFNISLSPGKIYRYPIKVKNFLSTPLPIRLEISDFDTADHDGKLLLNSTTGPFSLSRWISFKEKEAIIPAVGEFQTEVAVTIPQNVPLGGYYSIVFVNPILPQNKTSATNVNSKIGILFLSGVGTSDFTPKGSISKFEVESSLTGKRNLGLTFSVKNDSLSHVSAKPRLIVKPFFGKEKTYEIEEKFVFPGKSRNWKTLIQFDGILTGLYFTTLSVSLGGGNMLTSKKILFDAPLVRCLVVLSLIGLIIFLIRKRKRLKKALNIFFHS